MTLSSFFANNGIKFCNCSSNGFRSSIIIFVSHAILVFESSRSWSNKRQLFPVIAQMTTNKMSRIHKWCYCLLVFSNTSLCSDMRDIKLRSVGKKMTHFFKINQAWSLHQESNNLQQILNVKLLYLIYETGRSGLVGFFLGYNIKAHVYLQFNMAKKTETLLRKSWYIV